MSVGNKTEMMEQSLRAVSPTFYRYLVSAFESFHIHPYDIQANAIIQGDEVEVILRFGEDFHQTERRAFTLDTIEKGSQDITDFIKETGEVCKNVLIADYYKMMKP